MSPGNPRDRAHAGGKAAVLYELQTAGFCVPRFELVTADTADAELASIVARLGFPLAVRSSATVEDGRDSSFAGQFESFLNLQSLADVEQAVQHCRQSAHSPGLAAYCQQQAIDVSAVRMAVIVQQMIRPELAGVAITVNPTTGDDVVVVEAVAGLADGLLAGSSPPLPADHPLLQQHLPAITAVAKRIQRHFGAPQDIEFAIADGTLYVLQSRPITRIGFAPEIGEWTNAAFRDGGVSSSVCTPLMWSLYEFIWDHSLKSCLRDIRLFHGEFPAGRMFFGRPYWNLGAVKQAVAKIPGFKEREFDEDLQVKIEYEGDGQRTPTTPWSLLRALPTIWALPGFLRRQQRQAEELLAQSVELERCWEKESADAVADYRRLIEQSYFQIETTYFRTIFAVSLAKLEFKEWFPACDYPALVAALPEIRHLAPLRRMRAAADRGERDVAAVVAEFRHQCRWGLDIIHPRWDEDTQFVAQLFDNLPPPTNGAPRAAYERARSEARARLPRWQRGLFASKLDRLRRLVWLREELRDLSSRMYYRIRRQTQRLAAARGLGDEIFFQTFREILVDDRREIASRRDVYESYRNFAAPNEIGSRYRYHVTIPSGALQGIGASGGQAEGVARVARTVEEALTVEAGAILICPFTEPGWTVVLDRVAGVVTETGGQLSHAAVICREFGIPAVLGVAGATQRIRDGECVTIDGSAGLVTIKSLNSPEFR
jgi:phosphohistidine swiveling domain-containing protein